MPKIVRTLYDVAYDAICHLIEDDGFAMASHVALSILLAVFPFLIFGTTLANFLGADQFSSTAVHLIFDTWPEAIAKPVADQVLQVLTIPRGGLLTVSVLAAAYFASNGVEALRHIPQPRLPRDRRPGPGTSPASPASVMCSIAVDHLRRHQHPARRRACCALDYARQPAFRWLIGDLTRAANCFQLANLRHSPVVLTVGLLVVRTTGCRPAAGGFIDVLPGRDADDRFIWTRGRVSVFASYLATFANYAATYAGLASVMVVLVFLYMVGVIFIHRRRDQRGPDEIPDARHLRPQFSGRARRKRGQAPSKSRPGDRMSATESPWPRKHPRARLSPSLFESLRALRIPSPAGDGGRPAGAGPAAPAAAGAPPSLRKRSSPRTT